jgi:hypothetical protein
MKRLFTTWSALAACLLTGRVMAESPYWTPATTQTGTLAAYFDDVPASPEPADEGEEVVVSDDAEAVATDCDCAEESSNGCAEASDCCAESCECGDQAACGDDCACGDGCSSSANGDLCSGWSLCGPCCPGDAWTMQKWLCPCEDEITYAGWIQMGYHSETTGLSAEHGDLLDSNDVPDRFNLQQMWLYTEKAVEADSCSADWGYRFDMVYGTDAQKTQAFGNSGAPNANGWDNDWDHGVYGWAMPQAYVQVGLNDWTWKIGHWYTPMGYEVWPATGNFFYSHALQWYNSEPFTHTGVFGTYTGQEGYTYYAGWALGWDTGFDQYRDGNLFIGGLSREFNDDVTVSYLTCVGNYGFRSADEFGYSHTIVGLVDLTEKLQYVIQHDLVTEDGYLGDDTRDNFDAGITNYLFYTVNDCWKYGGRFEWWQSDTLDDDNSIAFFEVTLGVNYRPHANLVVRPEVRWDFTGDDDAVEVAQGRDYDRTIFGIDAIFTF